MVYKLVMKQLISLLLVVYRLSLAPLKTNGQRFEKAFTLVELSIVIVIMGLLVAATMAGRDLLSTSKLRAFIGEVEVYKAAVDGFQIQYEALPGDIKNASSFWSSSQNGNGDAKIGVSRNSTDYTEPYYAWNHLTLAKLVPGTFSGSSSSPATPGTNVPASKYIDGAGFCLNSNNPWNYADTLGRVFFSLYLYIGKADSTTNYNGYDAFTPNDALYIDSKLDDGTPDFGKILGGHASGTGVCTSGSAPNIIYDTTKTPLGCMLTINIDNK